MSSLDNDSNDMNNSKNKNNYKSNNSSYRCSRCSLLIPSSQLPKDIPEKQAPVASSYLLPSPGSTYPRPPLDFSYVSVSPSHYRPSYSQHHSQHHSQQNPSSQQHPSSSSSPASLARIKASTLSLDLPSSASYLRRLEAACQGKAEGSHCGMCVSVAEAALRKAVEGLEEAVEAKKREAKVRGVSREVNIGV